MHTFPKGICPKVNIIVQLEYELAYYDSTVHHFNHYTTRTPPVLFDPYHVLPLWVKVDLVVMAVKGYCTFSKASRLKPHYLII